MKKQVGHDNFVYAKVNKFNFLGLISDVVHVNETGINEKGGQRGRKKCRTWGDQRFPLSGWRKQTRGSRPIRMSKHNMTPNIFAY